jgi:transposase
MSDGIAGRQQFVGIDLHLHRSVIARIDRRGREVDCVRIDNGRDALVAEVVKAGPGAQVAIEATYGWYWAVDALRAAGFEVHLAHPYGLKAMRKRRRIKTDRVDAFELARLLRLGSLPEAYIAPPELRELRELVRHRQQLVKTSTATKAGIRGVLAKHGIRLEVTALDGITGTDLLDALSLPGGYAQRLAAQRRIMMVCEDEIARVTAELDRRLKTDSTYRNLLKVKGIGPVLAAMFVAEIGDVHRFRSAKSLTCWAGLTPRLHESDRTSHRGNISKEGCALVRWAAVEAIQRHCEPAIVQYKEQIIARRGKSARSIAKVAAARRMLEVVYYVMRDGDARCLHQPIDQAA